MRTGRFYYNRTTFVKYDMNRHGDVIRFDYTSEENIPLLNYLEL